MVNINRIINCRRQVLTKAPDDVSFVLVGSKSDYSGDVTKSAVRVEDIRRFSDLYCMSYFSTSAKLNRNIEQVSKILDFIFFFGT